MITVNGGGHTRLEPLFNMRDICAAVSLISLCSRLDQTREAAVEAAILPAAP